MSQEANPVSVCKLDAATAAANSACDGLDGVTDGVIGDPRQRDYDPAALVGATINCGATTEVFTAKDAEVLRAIWEGPRAPDGDFLWFGLEPGAPLTALANPAVPFSISTQWIQYWVLENPQWDYKTATYADFEAIFELSQTKFNELIGSDNPDLSAFKASGGKLLLWHGWSDQLIAPRGTIDYYERIQDTMGKGQTERFARLFMAPGVRHCSSGNGPGFDAFAALVRWVEDNKAPKEIVVTRTVDGQTVQGPPLCLYPRVNRYLGHGSTDDASNYSCQMSYAPQATRG